MWLDAFAALAAAPAAAAAAAGTTAGQQPVPVLQLPAQPADAADRHRFGRLQVRNRDSAQRR